MVYGLACQASARDGTSSKPLLTTSKRLLDEVDLTISDEEQSTGVALSAFELASKKRWHPTQTALLIALAEAAGVTPDWREIDHKVGRGGCEARYKGIRREQIYIQEISATGSTRLRVPVIPPAKQRPKQGSRGIELDSNFFSVFLGPWPQSLGPSRTIGTG